MLRICTSAKCNVTCRACPHSVPHVCDVINPELPMRCYRTRGTAKKCIPYEMRQEVTDHIAVEACQMAKQMLRIKWLPEPLTERLYCVAGLYRKPLTEQMVACIVGTWLFEMKTEALHPESEAVPDRRHND